MPPRRPHHRTFAAFLAFGAAAGLAGNLVTSPTAPLSAFLADLSPYLIGLAAVPVLLLVPRAQRYAKTIAFGLAYVVTAIEMMRTIATGGAYGPVWTLLIPAVALAIFTWAAYRWWEPALYGAFMVGLVALAPALGLVDPDGPFGQRVLLVVAFGIVLLTVALTLVTAIRIRTERQLDEARVQAEDATRAKSAFLATMSHEIRTPLNGVVGMADLLATTELDAEQDEAVGVIRASADALLTVVGDVLDFSKIEAGGVSTERIAFDPVRVALEALGIVRAPAEAKGLDVTLDADPDLPAQVTGDPTRLRQILLNLLSNAVKFTEQGGVTLSVAYTDGTLRYAVRDTGIGIAAHALPTLFDSFTQADASTTRRFGGTGLGLAISRRLAELMGGRLDAESALGSGSTFRLVVPAPEQQGAPAGLTGAPATGEPAPKLNRSDLRVLVAEDNAVNRKIVARLLGRQGIAADFAADGEEAVRAVRSAANIGAGYHLILMDVQMPLLDGHAATRQIRAGLPAHQQPYIAALTADAFADDRAASLAAGCDAHLVKPVRSDDLRALLGTVCAPRLAA